MRLQFSLRALLLLMAVVGAAIVLFRWPWTVTEQKRFQKITTQYRRSWNGKALKHGLRLTVDTTHHETRKEWFVDDELRRYWEESPGGFREDRSYRDRKLNGYYLASGTAGYQQGQYRQGVREGLWTIRHTSDLNVTEEYQNGKLHGLKTWLTREGKILQTARYEEERLVEWNGLSLTEAVERWAEEHVTDPQLRQAFLSRAQSITKTADGEELVFSAGDSLPPIVFYASFGPRMLDKSAEDQLIGERLLIASLPHLKTLGYRYHRILAVYVSETSLAWQDRTGVYDIQFEPGSKEEAFWLSRGEVDPNFSKHTGSWLKGMLYGRNGIQIQFDTTAVDAYEATYYPELDGRLGQRVPASRRDQIGEYLNQRRFYCELRGQTLVIKPHLSADGKREE